MIGNETNCTLEIVKGGSHGSWQSFHHRHYDDPSHIYIESKPGPSSPKDNIKWATEELEHSLLEYIHYQEYGRLFYDLARSCSFLHYKSKGTAVVQRNPFSLNQQGWLDIVELPYHQDHFTGQKVYHTRHIFSNAIGLLSRINSETGCLIKVCEHEPSTGETLMCDPYVFVFGQYLKHVDRAVMALKDAIRKHSRECSCVL